jgi:nucleoside-diphosphate-sugar epimerase
VTTIVWGGTGFLGTHIAYQLLDNGERPIVTTHRRGHLDDRLRDAVDHGEAAVEQVDLTSAHRVFEIVARHGPEGMIDASGFPPKTLGAAEEVSRRISALTNLLEAGRVFDVRRITLTSSMDAYWGLGETEMPFDEDARVPLQELEDNYIVQSWAKKSLEVIASLFVRQNGQDIVTVRASGIYGPLYRTFLNLPSRLIVQALHGNEAALPKIDGARPVAADGYDLAYVKDIARGIAMVHLAPSLQHRIYNIGSGRRVLHAEVTEAVREVFPDFEPQLPPPQQGPAGPYMSIKRAHRELGYAPEFSVATGVAEYAEWLRHHDR